MVTPMRAWQVKSLEGPDGLELVEIDDPQEGEEEVLIDVHAAGIAFPDVLMARGGYQDQPDLPFIPGIEAAGVVAAAPPGAGLTVGQRVAAYTRIGALAERVVAPLVSTFPLPDEIDAVAGAAGGLGSAAIQVARGLGARPLAIVSSDEKAAFARRAGADDVLAVGAPWPVAVSELLGGAGVDVVFDPVGGDRFGDSLRLLREDGRLVVVGFTSGEIPEVRVNRLILRNISVVGAGYGAYVAARPGAAAKVGEGVAKLVASGDVRPMVGHRFAFEDAREAFRLIERREALGKVVVEWSGGE